MPELAKVLKFNGGLNTVDPPSEIADNELTICDNFFIGDNGQLIKRGGFFKGTTLASVGTPYTIYGLNYTQGNIFVGAQGTLNSLYKLGYPSGSPVSITSLPGGEMPFWMLWIKETLYFGFISTPGVRTMAGTATVMGANIANSTGGKTAVFHKGRIFTTDWSNKGRISFSEPITPSAPVATWQTTSVLDVGMDEKDAITALVSMGDLLLIFKWRSVWTLHVQGTSPADWVLRRINGSLGCMEETYGKKATIVYNNECYFLASGGGLYKTNGSSFIELSRKIWQFPQGIFVTIPAYFRLALYRNYLIVLINDPNLTYTPKLKMFLCNLNNGAWSTWSILTGFHDLMVVPYSTASDSYPTLLGTIDNQLYNFNYEEDPHFYSAMITAGYSPFTDGFILNTPGSAYTAEFRSKEFMADADRLIRSKWTGLEYMSHASPSFHYIRDTVTMTATSPGFLSTTRKGYKIPGAGRGRSLTFVGSHAASSPFEFDKAVLHLAGKVPILASGTP